MVEVTLDGRSCIPLGLADNPVVLRIHNMSPWRIAIQAIGEDGPPYRLHQPSFYIENVDGTLRGDYYITLTHYFPPTHDVIVGPSDATEFVVAADPWPGSGAQGPFRLTVRDRNGHQHRSDPLPACKAG